MQEPTNRKGNGGGVSVALKVLAGLVAFFGLLCVGFVFFIAVVCGK